MTFLYITSGPGRSNACIIDWLRLVLIGNHAATFIKPNHNFSNLSVIGNFFSQGGRAAVASSVGPGPYSIFDSGGIKIHACSAETVLNYCYTLNSFKKCK